MCDFKNHYRPKKWYGHGRTGRTADDGPDIYTIKDVVRLKKSNVKIKVKRERSKICLPGLHQRSIVLTTIS